MIQRKHGLISIKTRRVGISTPLFPDFPESDEPEEEEEADEDYSDLTGCTGEAEEIELLMEGKLVVTRDRAELIWKESELTGMEGATTKVGFATDSPLLISMLRGGSVSTALIFEARKRHICIYNTPFSSFEVCVQTLAVENRLLTDGSLFLDYLIEIRGNRTERCRMWITFRETDASVPQNPGADT